MAIEINNYAKENTITDSSDLLDLESIDEQMVETWNRDLSDMRCDINQVNVDILKSIKGISGKLAKKILAAKDKIENFSSIEQLKEIDGIGKSKFLELKARFKIGE